MFANVLVEIGLLVSWILTPTSRVMNRVMSSESREVCGYVLGSSVQLREYPVRILKRSGEVCGIECMERIRVACLSFTDVRLQGRYEECTEVEK